MNKRYQVFISSTFEDLKEERKGIIETLLNAKYLPSGMEMFSASNEEQFKYIKKIIDDCDYYVLVLGARYGSVNTNSGKSFTEMEYEYALEKDIPILSFVHNDPENLPADKREKENIDLFNAFRLKVLTNSKMCKMWSEKSDLVANVVVSLIQIADECPRIGWSRGVQDTTELLTQINDLRNENEKLRAQNKELQLNEKSYQLDKSDLSQGDDEFEIVGKSYKGANEMYDYDHASFYTEWDSISDEKFVITWNEIFKHIAPEIFLPCDEFMYKNFINEFFEMAFTLEHFEISREYYNLIKYQMLALGWICIDKSNKISLTEKGRQEFMDVITLKK